VRGTGLFAHHVPGHKVGYPTLEFGRRRLVASTFGRSCGDDGAGKQQAYQQQEGDREECLFHSSILSMVDIDWVCD
jgi:hypothetical protein